MSFLHPAFLWALSALAIPVLIHLFQLRRFKRIDFPNVRYLAEVTQQTRARKKIQHWLVLLARCLAIACLVLAFAQPYLPGPTGAAQVGERAVSLFVDDSYSMDGTNASGRLLDQGHALDRHHREQEAHGGLEGERGARPLRVDDAGGGGGEQRGVGDHRGAPHR